MSDRRTAPSSDDGTGPARPRPAELLALTLVLAALGLGLAVRDQLPAHLALRFDHFGIPSASLPTTQALYAAPALGFCCLVGLFLAARFEKPPLDSGFLKAADRFVFAFGLFVFYVQTLVLAWNLKPDFSPHRALAPAAGLLLLAAADLSGRPKRPPEVESPRFRAARNTARLAFGAAGLASLIGYAFPEKALTLMLVSTLCAAVAALVAFAADRTDKTDPTGPAGPAGPANPDDADRPRRP